MDLRFDNKRVLITGGAGFIGSSLARRLVQLGADVHLLDNLDPKLGGNHSNILDILKEISINIADVRDKAVVEILVRDKDVLFNLAGQASHMDSMKNPYSDLEVNARGQIVLLEACRKYNPGVRIVFASTRQIYGRPQYLPVDESHPLNPIDVNGINKMAGEFYHTLYNRVYGIPTCSLRLTNTFGPRMRIKDARLTFLGIWIRCLLERKPFDVWNGQQIRDFTYIDDVVDAFLLAACNDAAIGTVFNIGGDKVIRLAELAGTLAKINGGGDYRISNFPRERQIIDIGDYYADYRLITSKLNWKPRVSLEAGLEATLSFYRDRIRDYL